MKKLEIVIQPEKLEALKAILDASNASGVMISNIMGYGCLLYTSPSPRDTR